MKAFTTEEIDKLVYKYAKGENVKLAKFCYYGDVQMRKGGILFAHTQDEIKEFAKCYNDPIYFIENYIKFFDPIKDEFTKIKLRDYQKKLIDDYFEYKFNLVASARQMGNSLVIAILMLYEALFSTDGYMIQLISNKSVNGVEIMSKVIDMYRALPYFIKPGVMNFNKTQILFDNGNVIRVSGAARQLPFGYQIHKLFVDDFAHFSRDKKNDLLRALMPVMSALKNSSVYISSGINGYDQFYEMLYNSERGLNDFNLNKLYWWDVPERDEKWKESQIKMLGSKEAFMQEYELAFIAKKGEL